jgi:nicotinate-nucleotide adenylyltransferase
MRRIGLLGGSFNPAHEGHRYISLLALKKLALHEIWWMVSPQNPLKTATDMAPFAERVSSARRVARHPRIRVTEIEQRLGSVYTAETLRLLLPRFPHSRFVWLMGADNLQQIWEWRYWQRIFTSIPIAVFARSSYSHRVLSGKAACYFASARVPESRAHHLAELPPPAWVFFHMRPHAQSATSIRARRAALSLTARETAVDDQDTAGIPERDRLQLTSTA